MAVAPRERCLPRALGRSDDLAASASAVAAAPAVLSSTRVRELTFFDEAGIGPWKSPRRRSLADLVLALTYVVTYEIPPRRVLNDVLVRGRLDAGMSGGCIWKPLELSEAEFGDLVDELERRGTRPVA